MRASKVLTDPAIKKAKPAPKGKRYDIWDASTPNFGVRVTSTGQKTFVVMKRLNGRLIRRKLGDYPALNLAKARKLAQAALEDIGDGVDPKVRQREREVEEMRKRAGLFRIVVQDFTRLHLVKLRSGDEIKTVIERELVPRWGRRPIADITRREIREAVEAVFDRGAPYAANRLLAFTRKLFNWARDRELIEFNPAAGLKPPGQESRRERVLDDDEVCRLWKATGAMSKAFGMMLRFLLVTAQRREEVGLMRWSDVDFDKAIWTIPRHQTKGDRAHEVPLSPLALSILESMPRQGELVFTTTGDKPLGNWSKAKAKADELSGASGWRIHDLRRTAATNMARAGVSRLVISRVLNHVEGGVTHIYDRASYLDEKREALCRWAANLADHIARNEAKAGADAACREGDGSDTAPRQSAAVLDTAEIVN
jgi:integrase